MNTMTAVLMTNTEVDFKEMSEVEFINSQQIMKAPEVIFCNLETREAFERFDIVAESMKELHLMYDKKIFFTSSIPEGHTKHLHGAIFYGVRADYYQTEKRRSAATERTNKDLN